MGRNAPLFLERVLEKLIERLRPWKTAFYLVYGIVLGSAGMYGHTLWEKVYDKDRASLVDKAQCGGPKQAVTITLADGSQYGCVSNGYYPSKR